MDIHIGSEGTKVRFAAGYLNRAARRRLSKASKRRSIPTQTVARKNA